MKCKTKTNEITHANKSLREWIWRRKVKSRLLLGKPTDVCTCFVAVDWEIKVFPSCWWRQVLRHHEQEEEGDETDSEETGGKDPMERRGQCLSPSLWVEPMLGASCSRLFSSVLTATSTARNWGSQSLGVVFSFFSPTIHPDHCSPSLHSFQSPRGLPVPQIHDPSASFQKRASLSGYQPNMVWQNTVTPGPRPHIKAGWSDQVEGEGSQE